MIGADTLHAINSLRERVEANEARTRKAIQYMLDKLGEKEVEAILAPLSPEDEAQRRIDDKAKYLRPYGDNNWQLYQIAKNLLAESIAREMPS